MKKMRTEVLVGTFVIFGFILLSLTVFFVSGVYLVRPGYKVNVIFGYVSILDRGAPVRMAGVRIGEVNRVNFIEDKQTGQTKVQVQLFIAKGFEIRENYTFSVRGTHVLSEPHIEITPQPGNAPFLKENDRVQGEDPVALEVLVNRADQIASHLDTVLSGLDKDAPDTFKNLSASTASLERILARIEKGEGTAGQIFVNDELYQEIRDFVAELKAHPWRLLKKDDKEDKKDKKKD